MLKSDGHNGPGYKLFRRATGKKFVEHLSFLGCRDGSVEVFHEALADIGAGWGWKGW